jgi:DNA-binding MarR family transcriptional regulator
MPTKESANALLAHELRETLGRVVRRMRAEPGPSVGRMAALGRLERGGPSSISAMAACERMRPQSIAEIVHDLEADGLVSRRPDPTDGRRVVIELTDAGLDLLHNTRETRETWLTDVLERELDSNERILLQRTLSLLNRIAEAETQVPPRTGR